MVVDSLKQWPHVTLPWKKREMPGGVIDTIARMVERENKNKGMQEGWICPRCGKVNAPWVPSCDCKPEELNVPTKEDLEKWMRETHVVPGPGPVVTQEEMVKIFGEPGLYDGISGDDLVPSACYKCPNNPQNGGSGHCNCMLGDVKVTCQINGK